MDPVAIGIGAVAGIIVGFILTMVIIKNSSNSSVKAPENWKPTMPFPAPNPMPAEIVKKAEVDGKAEYLRIKETAEKEVETMRKEMREQEQRLQKREDMLDRKLDTLSIKEKNLESTGDAA